jgi:hypothetical protein
MLAAHLEVLTEDSASVRRTEDAGILKYTQPS